MTDIAKDGDLGDLGKDQIGNTAGGVPPDLYNAFHDALDDFKGAVASLNEARASAERSVALVEGWVALGNRLMDIAAPFLAQLAQQHATANGPAATPGDPKLPAWYAQLVGANQGIEGIQKLIAGGLGNFFPRG